MIKTMVKFRVHGEPPFKIAVIHGGPGAWGEMKPIARYISNQFGVIEPFLLSPTLEGQLKELEEILSMHKIKKITLIGFSWGAWIAYLFAARHTKKVSQVIIIGSGPYEHKYYLQLTKTRESRMTPEQKFSYHTLLKKLQDPAETDRDRYITKLGDLCHVTDQYRNDPSNNPANSEDRIHFDVDRSVHFQKALNEAIEMRKSGELQEEGKNISCPVTAIHGVYDPHPIDGVKIPLEKNIADFRIFPLEKCGHMPWTETYAKTTFYNLLTEILEAEPSK